MDALLALFLAAAMASIEPARAAGARDPQADEYTVIVNPANPVRSLSRDFVRLVYLKKNATWSDGETIRPVGLSRRFAARERFTREILNKTPTQLRAYWNQQIFSGKGVPPPELDTAAAVVAYVLRNRGAVGLLPVGADPAGAAVVSVK